MRKLMINLNNNIIVIISTYFVKILISFSDYIYQKDILSS